MAAAKPSPPVDTREEVFKYCDSRGVDILRNLELKITPPAQFNDPFEFTPRVICSSPDYHVKRLYDDKGGLKVMFQEQKREGLFKGDFREFKKGIRALRQDFRARLVERIPEINANLQAKQLNAVSRELGVLCLSSRPDSIVMWGHYSDKHTGIVIGFDRSWSVFHDKKGLRPVQYVRERTIWDTSYPRNSKEAEEASDMMIFSKNDEWRYEGELRQLFMLEGLGQRALDNGTRGYFRSVPSEMIVSVCLGFRCPGPYEEEIRSVLKAPHFAHVKLCKASLHNEEFALRID